MKDKKNLSKEDIEKMYLQISNTIIKKTNEIESEKNEKE